MGNTLLIFKTEKYWIKDYYLEPIIYFIHKSFEERLNLGLIEDRRAKIIEAYNKELELYFIGASDGALDLNISTLSKEPLDLNLLVEVLTSVATVLGSIDVDLTLGDFEEVGNYSFGAYQSKNFRLNTKMLAKKTSEILNLLVSNYSIY